MTDLDTFRMDTRAWLEENCPPEMREPVKSDKDACWGWASTFEIRHGRTKGRTFAAHCAR